jgi:glycerol-3-phosphate dehydrogenase (NAD(P)+)
MKKIIIIGAGAMGSAFAVPCLENQNEVTLVGTQLEDNLIENINLNNNVHNAINIELP